LLENEDKTKVVHLIFEFVIQTYEKIGCKIRKEPELPRSISGSVILFIAPACLVVLVVMVL